MDDHITGPDDTGPDDTGPDDTGPDDTGPDDTGPDDTGPDDTGPDVLDERFTWGLILDVFQVLTGHGYLRHSHHATGAAVGVLGELCRVYEGKHHR
jgi:hypothetical protein